MSATMAAARTQPEVGSDSPVLRITPVGGWLPLGLREIVQHRELLFFLVWRDIKVRYKMAALGAAWAVLQPLLTMLIFGLFFGRLARVPSDGIPYPLFSFAALVPWTFFATGLQQSSNSIVGSTNLITKVYFPRLTIPTASVLAGFVDFSIGGVVLLILMGFYHRTPSWHLLWLPAFAILALVSSLGVGLWLSALNVRFRDVRYVVPFLVQFWMFATPIAYPSTLLSPRWRTVYGLNPMVGVVEGFRWALFGTHIQAGPVILASALAALLVLVGGAYYFRSVEVRFADFL